jgi:hypothetical protein
VTFLHETRRRVLWVVAGVGVTALAVVSWTALPALPVVGVAVAAIALVVNRMTAGLRESVCLGCGQDVSQLPHGEHGVICPNCGHITSNMHLAEDPVGPTIIPDPEDDEDALA